MRTFQLLDLLKAIGGNLILGDPQVSIGLNLGRSVQGQESGALPVSCGISIDSRTVQKGDIFFALVGIQKDGHEFLNQAVNRGASALVVSHIPDTLKVDPLKHFAIIKVDNTLIALQKFAGFYRQQVAPDVRVVAVTGSSGKTTVKEMLAEMLSQYAETVRSEKNFNNAIGCPLSLFALRPESKFGVFEIGSSSIGEVARLAEVVRPQGAIVTSIHLEHTESFGSLENIVQGESETFAYLKAGGFAIFPQEGEYADALRLRVPDGVAQVTFGWSSAANIWVGEVKQWPQQNQFQICYRDLGAAKKSGSFWVENGIAGKINRLNALPAAAAALLLGASEADIQAALRQFRGVAMRFQKYKTIRGLELIDDSYNANPGSMRASIESFVEMYPDKARVLVLGDMLELGEISREQHRQLGEWIAQLPIDKIYLIGAQSRFILEGAKKNFIADESITLLDRADQVVEKIKQLEASRTVLLLKASRGIGLDAVVKQILKEEV